MKLIHLADLHLGKRLFEFSLGDDQRYILESIDKIAEEHSVDTMVISGDVFDKRIPSAEAVTLFDDYLTRQVRAGRRVAVIAGNHDSAERLAFGSRVMDASGVYVAGPFDGTIRSFQLEDEWGRVVFWPIPFLHPSVVRAFFGDEENEINTWNDAVGTVFGTFAVDESVRNVALSHQFLTGSVTAGSEEVTIGGMENVDAALYERFDYAALGHLHRAQSVGRETIRYAGTPLGYSLSETEEKSVTVVQLGQKGDVQIETIPLKPLRAIRRWRGTWDTWRAESLKTDDWLGVTLTDAAEIPDAFAQIRRLCPNLLRLDYDNAQTRREGEIDAFDPVMSKTPAQRVAEFFEAANGRPLSEFQRKLVEELLPETEEDA